MYLPYCWKVINEMQAFAGSQEKGRESSDCRLDIQNIWKIVLRQKSELFGQAKVGGALPLYTDVTICICGNPCTADTSQN